MANDQGFPTNGRDSQEEEESASSTGPDWTNKSDTLIVNDDERVLLFKKGVKWVVIHVQYTVINM